MILMAFVRAIPGGSAVENRIRLLIEVTQALISTAGTTALEKDALNS